MDKAKNGDTVKVHYTGNLEDGTVFDSSAGDEPLEFTIGEREVIPGFEQAVVGMGRGDEKTVDIPSAAAYGPHHPELVIEVQREVFPDDLEPEVGQVLEMRRPDGDAMTVHVTSVAGPNVTLDANHPLAGQSLTFKLELVEIVAAAD